METARNIKKIVTAHATVEGAGVHLQRAIGFDNSYDYDPFLLLDDFRSDNSADYIKGFPWHPHRGIETITYVLKGSMTHEDSLGHKGTIGEGDVQWMTAGSGIYHQEMPVGDADGTLYGFQLWANLPAKYKMMQPRYRGITAERIPVIRETDGMVVRIIAGTYKGTTGPVTDVVTSPEYYDIFIPENSETVLHTQKGSAVLFYIFEGKGSVIVPQEDKPQNLRGERLRDVTVRNRDLIVFGAGDFIRLKTEKQGMRFLMLSGKPIGEPIAWYGPIVMNNEEELRTAYDELEKGTFIKGE